MAQKKKEPSETLKKILERRENPSKPTKLHKSKPFPQSLFSVALLLALTQPALLQFSKIGIIQKIQELTLDGIPPAVETPFTGGEFFSESHKIGMVTFSPEFKFQVWDVKLNQCTKKIEYSDNSEQVVRLIPISKTSYMWVDQWIRYFYLYDLNDETGAIKVFEIGSNERINLKGEHIKETNYVLKLNYVDSGDKFWAIYDYTQPTGLLSPYRKYTHPNTEGYVRGIINIKKTVNLFTHIRDKSYFDNLYTQEYTSKAFLTQFDKVDERTSIRDIFSLDNTDWILVSQSTGGIFIYDWTGVLGTAPIKKILYQGFVHSRIHSVPEKDLIVLGDYHRNNYFFLDVRKDFEYVNHRIYKNPEDRVSEIFPSYDGEYYLIVSKLSSAVLRVIF